MGKRFFLISLLFFIAFIIPRTVSVALASAAPCDLFTRADAEALFKETVSEGISRETTFPAGKSCRYSFSKNGGTYGLKIRISETAEIKAEGIQESAADVMDRQKKARKESENASKTFHTLSGLGDDAFWNGNDLWVLKGDSLLIITVNSFLGGSFKDRGAMDKAHSEQELALSREVAKTILSRLK